MATRARFIPRAHGIGTLAALGGAALAVAAALGACQGSARTSRDDAPVLADAAPRLQEPAPQPAPSGPEPIPAFAPSEDEEAALAAAGIIDVWDAVVDRGAYLARRRQHGALRGRMGDAADRYRWLVDESEGAGALGIRVLYSRAGELEAGQRVVLWGAWEVDDERRWYWHAERAATLAPRDAAIPPEIEATPGHVIASIAEPPAGAVPVSQRSRGPGDILFEVVRAPSDPAYGWEIADRADQDPVARLFLPGERLAYGGQDFRRPDERWKLERGALYAVRVGRFLAPKPGALIRMTAIGAPRRITRRGNGADRPAPRLVQ